MENNEVRLIGYVKRWPRRFSNPEYGEDRVSFALVIPTVRETGPSVCIFDISAESEDTREIGLELRPDDHVEVSGWLRARSKQVNGHKQNISEVVVEKIAVLPNGNQP